MKRLSHACCILLAATSAGAAQPSFDCGKAPAGVEAMLCQDEQLASLDRELDRPDLRWPEPGLGPDRVAQCLLLCPRTGTRGPGHYSGDEYAALWVNGDDAQLLLADRPAMDCKIEPPG